MEPSSRTPEGQPNHCPVCSNDICMEPSRPTGHAPCPHCGHLLWFPLTAGEDTFEIRVVDDIASQLVENNRILLGGTGRADVETLKDCLSEVDCETRLAKYPQVILALVQKWRPALLLLNPSIADRLDICRVIKNDRGTRKTMVVMVGGLNEVSDIEQVVDSGADDFISMPIDRSELLARVRNLLRLRHIMEQTDRTDGEAQ